MTHTCPSRDTFITVSFALPCDVSMLWRSRLTGRRLVNDTKWLMADEMKMFAWKGATAIKSETSLLGFFFCFFFCSPSSSLFFLFVSSPASSSSSPPPPPLLLTRLLFHFLLVFLFILVLILSLFSSSSSSSLLFLPLPPPPSLLSIHWHVFPVTLFE